MKGRNVILKKLAEGLEVIRQVLLFSPPLG